MKKNLVSMIVLLLAGTLCGWLGCHRKTDSRQVSYRTAFIGRSAITQDISAAGIVQPIQKINISTQVTGPILELKVDYNSVVKKGDIIAKIDSTKYQAAYDTTAAQLNSAKAAVETAKAQLLTANAALAANESKLKFARRDLERVIKLHDRKMLSDADYDNKASECEQIETQIESSKAAIAAAQSAIGQAEAAVLQYEAAQRHALANLNDCTITTPINGIILSRNVEEGQTVVSNMAESTLFTVATDLSRIQVEAAISEADIGQIAKGQKVIFTVDAFPINFIGVVQDIRLDAKTETNVVSYPVIIEADNQEGKLYPGMTANLSIIVVEKTNVLAIPVAALSFQGPFAQAPQSSAKTAATGGEGSGNTPGMSSLPDKPYLPVPPVAKDHSSYKTIWILDDEQEPQPVEVRLGATDGVNQEIIADIPLEGKSVIIGTLSAAEN